MLADHFRSTYAHERDCNQKILTMLASVPEERRTEPAFERAYDLMVHMVAARRIWIVRLRPAETRAGWSPEGRSLAELTRLVDEIEAAWDMYMNELDDTELARELTWTRPDGSRWQWIVEEMLVQAHEHSVYHRGQIAVLVDSLGGEVMNTDFMLWTPNVHRLG